MQTEAIAEPPHTERHNGRSNLIHEARSLLVVTLTLAMIAGILFPAFVIGAGQVVFPHQATGSLIRNEAGTVIGSDLIGQRFSGPEFFQVRPSAAGADGYNAAASSGLNLALTNPELLVTLEERAAAFRSGNSLSSADTLPADAITTSASGLDPHISPETAFLQVRRVSQARGLTEDAVRRLVERHIEGRELGLLGEPRVNVLRLNLALETAR
jgi:K+-transporting ATPase ATPase C chain